MKDRLEAFCLYRLVNAYVSCVIFFCDISSKVKYPLFPLQRHHLIEALTDVHTCTLVCACASSFTAHSLAHANQKDIIGEASATQTVLFLFSLRIIEELYTRRDKRRNFHRGVAIVAAALLFLTQKSLSYLHVVAAVAVVVAVRRHHVARPHAHETATIDVHLFIFFPHRPSSKTRFYFQSWRSGAPRRRSAVPGPWQSGGGIFVR